MHQTTRLAAKNEEGIPWLRHPVGLAVIAVNGAVFLIREKGNIGFLMTFADAVG